MNIAWCSKIKEEPGKLYFPIDHYGNKQNSDTDVRIVILHHPLNWFSQSIYRRFREFVRKLANIVVTGHEHIGNVGIINDAESDESAFVEGCVLQDGENPSNSAFNIIVLDLDNGKFASTRYTWEGDKYAASIEGSWSDYRDLPQKRKISTFPLLPSFQDKLTDPGAFFKHPGGVNITLSDIYVYPDLLKVHNGVSTEKKRNYISSRQLLSPPMTADGVLIEGDEKTGGTSLLYQLFNNYHGQGFVPLLLNGKDFRKTTALEMDNCIKHAFQAQYGKELQTRFEQTPLSQKILLLDDFDDGPMRAADARAEILCMLRKRFGHLVITVSEMFEVREILDDNSSAELLSLEHYKLQTFNYTLRSKLIERWYSLGKDGSMDEAKFIARCDQAEKLMDAVMTKMVIPSLPLYLLTLLQSLEAGRAGEFKESALGHYYQFLLTEAFQSSGVKPDKLTEVFQYSAQLSWEYHCRNKQELTEIELRDFNTRFCKEWHTVDFLARIEELVNAKVLRRVGEDYSFRYPYIYYYLKGKCLSDKLLDLDIRAYIGHCCKHLYVRDYANTILFLAHHTNDEYVINTISESLRGQFRSCIPVAFDGTDTTNVQKLISAIPKLIYDKAPPSEHRKKRNEHRDRLNDVTDGLAECEEQAEQLSLIAQITILSKTTEILGQVLKNQYSKINRNRKADLLEELFNGPLRAIRSFYDIFEKDSNGFVAEIEAAIKRKGNIENADDRKAFAQKLVAGIIQIVTFSFIMRAVQGASSDSLMEDVNNIVKRNGTLAFKLIELGIILDSPKQLPRAQIKQLHKEAEKDAVAARLLNILVLNRLYMFKTIEQDMQWINAELRIDLGVQHSISYQDNKKKYLK